MKAKRVAYTVGQDILFAALVVSGLTFGIVWAWNVFLFLFGFQCVIGFLFAVYICNKENGKDRVRAYSPEKLTRCVWTWWNYLSAFGTGAFMAAYGHFFMAAAWMFCWCTNEAIYERMKELRADIAKESE